jgi:hypothetical protein
MHTIGLFVVLHEEEWVEVKVAKEGDVGPESNYKEQACHGQDMELTPPASNTCTWLKAHA